VAHDRNVKKHNYRFCWPDPYVRQPKPIASTDDKWRVPMKTMIIAAFSVLSLGVSAASAQGLPASGVTPVYGSRAFSNHSEPQVHFLGNGTVFAKLFGHSQSGQAVTDKTAELKTTSAKGS